jgi:hypothetical protein
LKREEIEKSKSKNKKTLKAHRSYNDDIIGIIEKISTRRIQRHQIRSQMVKEVGHTRRLKVSGLICLWAARVSHYDHHWWPSLMSLDLSHRDLLTIPAVSLLEFRCVSKIFFFFFFSHLILLNLVSSKLANWESRVWHLLLVNHIYYLQLSKLCYFLKYFSHYIILLKKILCWSPNKLQKN